MVEGHCLCGSVRIEVGAHRPETSACHCGLCRRWTGAAQWGFEAEAGEVRVAGEVRTYRAVPFAERAFCPACGTHLWLRDDDGPYEFVPALFDAARAYPLVREVYADRAFACVTLSGDHPRISRADYERDNPHVEGDTP
ncbi:GFA family protein [Rhodobacterales bacterium HKCCE2091]|nr:GFA family protein [Rhodobacterales bacterium HKCCE2091]